MIIGETFQGDYDGYEEESYDYLFKRRTKEERQQKRTERKEKRAEKEQQKQDTSGENSKHPLLGNFGMFDKNKKKNTKGSSGDTSGSSSNEEAKKTATGATTGATQDKSESSPPANEAEAGKQDTKDLDKNGKPKEAGFGPMFGFAMLGVTVLVIGAVLYGTNKRSKEILPPMKVAA
ncbi:hypothetical protein HYX58_06470 [Candidatus Dependentiae bacterium]|nr:hypothetical protein [Candidatus Dependentiae bacterium]